MRPLVLLALVLAACGSSSKGGSGSSGNSPTANGTECAPTTAGAASCKGQVCLTLNDNQQGKTGICTENCAASGTCAAGGTCYNIPSGPAAGDYCFIPCQGDGDCSGGFVCVSGICLVEATAAGGADCAAAQCPTQTDSDSIQAYCGNVPGTTQVCDCPGAPPTGCTASNNGANLWCCP